MTRPLPAPSGVVFDLDGTLVDTVDARIGGWLEALAEAGFPTSRAAVAPMIGMDGKQLAREIVRGAGGSIDEARVEEIDRLAGAAFDRRNRQPRALAGVATIVAALGDRAVPWAIATSSRPEQVAGSVAALGLASQPLIVDGSHVAHAKPAPDLLWLSADRLGAMRSRCWYVGDSTWDMRAAVAAGMPGVGVTAGSAVSAGDLTAAGATAVVDTLGDLVPRLRNPARR
jgi:phosphoglycolate phosphatase-like HAD superfamily hydrolase